MGAKQTRLRQIYNNMKYRCYAPNLDERTAKAYRDKGIRVCEEWLGYYGNFESWALSHGYKDGLSIDRIDPNGNYCPENCRWVTVEDNRAKRGTPCGAKAGEKFQTLTADEITKLEKLCDLVSQMTASQKEIWLSCVEGYADGYMSANRELERQPAVPTTPKTAESESATEERLNNLLSNMDERQCELFLVRGEGFVKGYKAGKQAAAPCPTA